MARNDAARRLAGVPPRTRLSVAGRLVQRCWTTDDGTKHEQVEIELDRLEVLDRFPEDAS